MQTTWWRRRRVAWGLACALGCLGLASGCAPDTSPTSDAAYLPASGGPRASDPPAPAVSSAVPPPSTPAAKAVPSPPATAPATHRRPAAHTPAPSRRPLARPRVAAAPATCAVGSGVGASRVVLVQSSEVHATISACRRSGGRYLRELGPYPGWVGRSGTVAASGKREGDGHTPRGVFALRGGFGTAADPGLSAGWLRVGANDVWVDDPASALYNSHQRKPVAGRWRSAEDLAIPAYRYAQVIGWNEARTPGRGSAIFLHVSTGRSTAGCVSLSSTALRAVMRWERSGTVIAIR